MLFTQPWNSEAFIQISANFGSIFAWIAEGKAINDKKGIMNLFIQKTVLKIITLVLNLYIGYILIEIKEKNIFKIIFSLWKVFH